MQSCNLSLKKWPPQVTHVLSSLRQHLLNGTSEMLTDAFPNNDFDFSSFAFPRNGDLFQVGLCVI